MRLATIVESVPVVKRAVYHPAAVYIQFPSGETWEYVLYDDALLRDLLRRYKRNTGQLVAVLKRMNVEAQRVGEKTASDDLPNARVVGEGQT